MDSELPAPIAGYFALDGERIAELEI